jgi:hypothetical protein
MLRCPSFLTLMEKNMSLPITRNQASFATITIGSLATVGSIITAATATSGVAIAAFAIMAAASSSLTLGGCTAYLSTEEHDPADRYFAICSDHIAKAFVGIVSTGSQLFATVVVEKAVEGFGNGVKGAIEDWFFGKQNTKNIRVL